MARFDPNKYPIITGHAQSQQAFDPSKYPILNNTGAEAGRQLMESMRQGMLSTEDLIQGMRAGLQNTVAFLTSGLPEGMQIPRFDPEPTSSYGQLPIEAGKLLSSFIPGIGAERAVAAGLGAVKGIPQALSRIGAGAAGGAASAPSFDVSPGVGAAFGAVGGAIPSVLKGAMGKFLGRNVTAEQFESARQAVPPHIRAPIGQLADSPSAKTLFEKTRGIALSGADKPMKQMFNHLTQGMEGLIEDAPGVGSADQFVFDDMKVAYESAKSNTTNAYDALAEHADINDVPFSAEKYNKNITDSLAEIQSETTNVKGQEFSEDVSGLYKTVKGQLQRFEKSPINTFSDATKIRKSLNKIIQKSYSEKDLVSARHLEKLKAGLDDSIAESAAQNPELLQLHKSANDARIHQGTFENLDRKKTPFFKIHSKDGDPGGFIASHIKTDNKGSDFSSLLGHLTEKLSPEARSVVAKSHINPEGETTLAKQLSKLGKLSPNQRNLMFGDKAPAAHELNKLSKLFGGAKSADFTPKTGFTGGKLGQLFIHSGALGASLATQHPGVLASAAAVPLGGQALQRFLRSNFLKKEYAKYLKQQPGAVPKTSKKGLLARALALQSVGGEQNGS